jgi:hypothetical protein
MRQTIEQLQEIPAIEKFLYTRKVFLKLEDLPEEYAKTEGTGWQFELITKVYFRQDNRLNIGTSMYSYYEDKCQRVAVSSTELPYFDPTNYTDEQIIERIKILLTFS